MAARAFRFTYRRFDVRVMPDAEAASALVADRIARALRATPSLVLGLPTGRTPIGVYRRLVLLHDRGRADFARATTFNLDEFWTVGPTDPGSYRAYMERHFFRHLKRRPRRVHLLNGAAPDAAAECDRFERAIRRAGGIDLIVLGLGANGHIAFNEPGPTWAADTHLARLRPETRRANAALFGGHWRRVPALGLTMGIGTILRAREVILLATGRNKASAVSRVVLGPVTPWVPGSVLQLHDHVTVVVDRAAWGNRHIPLGTRGVPISSRRRGSMSSPIASRIESLDWRSRVTARR